MEKVVEEKDIFILRIFMIEYAKYGTARQTTQDSIIRRMRFAYWITEATDTRSEYVTLIPFYGNNGYANSLYCCAILILLILSVLIIV